MNIVKKLILGTAILGGLTVGFIPTYANMDPLPVTFLNYQWQNTKKIMDAGSLISAVPSYTAGVVSGVNFSGASKIIVQLVNGNTNIGSPQTFYYFSDDVWENMAKSTYSTVKDLYKSIKRFQVNNFGLMYFRFDMGETSINDNGITDISKVNCNHKLKIMVEDGNHIGGYISILDILRSYYQSGKGFEVIANANTEEVQQAAGAVVTITPKEGDIQYGFKGGFTNREIGKSGQILLVKDSTYSESGTQIIKQYPVWEDPAIIIKQTKLTSVNVSEDITADRSIYAGYNETTPSNSKVILNGSDGSVTATGKITGGGFDAGSGSITTTGAITGASLTAASIQNAASSPTFSVTSVGAISGSNLTATGTVKSTAASGNNAFEATAGNITATAGNIVAGNSTTNVTMKATDGSVTATGKITGGGFDAGSGSITTTGAITGASLIAASIQNAASSPTFSVTSAGAISGGDLTATGTVKSTAASGNNAFEATAGNITATAGIIVAGNATTNVTMKATDGSVTATGKITGGGFDAGSGSITTTGAITGALLTAASIQNAASSPTFSVTSAGAISGGDLTATGTVKSTIASGNNAFEATAGNITATAGNIVAGNSTTNVTMKATDGSVTATGAISGGALTATGAVALGTTNATTPTTTTVNGNLQIKANGQTGLAADQILASSDGNGTAKWINKSGILPQDVAGKVLVSKVDGNGNATVPEFSNTVTLGYNDGTTAHAGSLTVSDGAAEAKTSRIFMDGSKNRLILGTGDTQLGGGTDVKGYLFAGESGDDVRVNYITGTNLSVSGHQIGASFGYSNAGSTVTNGVYDWNIGANTTVNAGAIYVTSTQAGSTGASTLGIVQGPALTVTNGTTPAFYAGNTGNVYAAGNAVIGGTLKAGATAVSALQVGTSTTAGNVLTADVSGNATWQALSAAQIPSLDAAKITSGALDAARIPSITNDMLAGSIAPAKLTSAASGQVLGYSASGNAWIDASTLTVGTANNITSATTDEGKILTGTSTANTSAWKSPSELNLVTTTGGKIPTSVYTGAVPAATGTLLLTSTNGTLGWTAQAAPTASEIAAAINDDANTTNLINASKLTGTLPSTVYTGTAPTTAGVLTTNASGDISWSAASGITGSYSIETVSTASLAETSTSTVIICTNLSGTITLPTMGVNNGTIKYIVNQGPQDITVDSNGTDSNGNITVSSGQTLMVIWSGSIWVKLSIN